jgi:hypothetical protein
MEIAVVDHLGRLIQETVQFHLDLKYFSHHHPESSQQISCNEYFEITMPGGSVSGIEGATIVTDSDGKCYLIIKILKLSSEVAPLSQFHFVATPSSPVHSCGISQAFSCIQYRLVVTNVDQLPSVWYKDQSYSKTHVVPVHIQLQSATGIVEGMVVPLKVQLRYCGKDGVIEILPIPDQNILKITSPISSSPFISQKGFCDIECNFTQVSSRHQHRNFAFSIQADPCCAAASLVSPVECGNIEVRSKVWKKKVKESDRLVKDLPTTLTASPGLALSSNSFPNTRGSLKRTLDQMGNEVHQSDEHEASSPFAQQILQSHLLSQQSPPFKSPLLDFHPEHSLFSDIFDGSHRSNPELINEWIHEVMCQIKNLKWREIGREDVPCQSSGIDQIIYQSVPLYDMPFPNQTIDHILEAYLRFFPDSSLPSDSFNSSRVQSVAESQLTNSDTTIGSGTDSNMSGSGVSLKENEQTPFYHHSPRLNQNSHTTSTYRDPFLPSSSPSFSPQRIFRGSRSNSLGSQGGGGQRSACALFAISEDTKGEN